MRFRAVVFDLDGTLLDTLADIAASANGVLQKHGFPTHSLEDYRHFIGAGLDVLMRRILPEDARSTEFIARCVVEFRRLYESQWNVHTRLYPGIAELLDALASRDVPTAILSNKLHYFTVKCAEHYLARWDFREVMGQRSNVPPKPDPSGARQIVQALALPADETIYLGDSGVDMETARAAGMHPVGAAWGFRPVEELREAGAAEIVEAPLELLELMDRP